MKVMPVQETERKRWFNVYRHAKGLLDYSKKMIKSIPCEKCRLKHGPEFKCSQYFHIKE